jgi:hypothetical protein
MSYPRTQGWEASVIILHFGHSHKTGCLFVSPSALPGPETTPKSGSASARPDVGPVLPLTSSAGDHDSELLGGKDHSTQTTSDSIAAKVLSRGETMAAPAGRADDFSWPRSGSDASRKSEVSPEPVAVAPGAPETHKRDAQQFRRRSRTTANAGSPVLRAKVQNPFTLLPVTSRLSCCLEFASFELLNVDRPKN